MFTKTQLLDAIEELEAAPVVTFQNCEKLATFYSLYDHLYGDNKLRNSPEGVQEVIIGRYGHSDFLEAVEGKEASSVWSILDELMDTIQAFNPRLYDATLNQLRE